MELEGQEAMGQRNNDGANANQNQGADQQMNQPIEEPQLKLFKLNIYDPFIEQYKRMMLKGCNFYEGEHFKVEAKDYIHSSRMLDDFMKTAETSHLSEFAMINHTDEYAQYKVDEGFERLLFNHEPKTLKLSMFDGESFNELSRVHIMPFV